MKLRLSIPTCAVAGVLAAAACLMPPARSAELVTLRNGFQMQCDRHAAAGGSVRIYFTTGNDNYIELPPSQIASVSQIAATPSSPEGTGFSPDETAAKSARASQAAEKGVSRRESSERHPSGPKGPTDFGLYTARLKSCPFKATSFSAASKVVPCYKIPGGSSFSAACSAPEGRFSPNSSDRSASIQPVLTSADLRQMLAKAGRSHNLDVDLLASVVHAESGGNPRAVSRAGARGLMQLMPTTAAALGVQNSFQPQQNVGGGSAYLDVLLARYNDNLALALAAYNAGPQAVDRYRGVPPYPETRAYVARVIHEFNRRVLARRAAAAHPLPHKLQAAVSQK